MSRMADINIETMATRLVSDALSMVKDVETQILAAIASTVPVIQVPCHRSDLVKITQLEAAIQQLLLGAQKIQKTFERMDRALAVARNHLVDINTFPDEILSAIFLNSQIEDDDEGFLPLARTCSRWKQVCLSSPDLWSQVTLPRDIGDAQELLTLAKLSSCSVGTLTVAHGTLPTAVLPSFDAISQRIHCLVLMNWEGTIDLACGFSTLQEFEVIMNPLRLNDPPLKFIMQRPLVETTILKTVILSDCRFLYLPDCYRGLTTLNIRYRSMCPRSTHINDQDGRLSDVLRACSDLETLVLFGTPMSLEEAMTLIQRPPEHPRMIPLLRLRRLHLSLWMHVLTGLLRHIETSSSLVEVDLGIYPLETEVDWMSEPEVRQLLQDTLLNIDIPVCLPMLTEVDTLSIGFICHAVCVFRKPSARSVAPSPFTLTFGRSGRLLHEEPERCDSLRTSRRNIFLSTSRHDVLRSVHTLHIHEPVCRDGEQYTQELMNRHISQFPDLLRQMPRLHTLILSTRHCNACLHAFIAARTPSDSTTSPLAPELRVLVMRLVCLEDEDDVSTFAQHAGKLGIEEVVLEQCWVATSRGAWGAKSTVDSEKSIVDALRKEGVLVVKCSKFRQGLPDRL